MDIDKAHEKIDLENLKKLKNRFYDAFGRLSENDGRTIEFYYKMGETRGVDGFQYVAEAIKRASMKKKLDKPISYIASLCKNFYKNGLYAQPFQEEKDIIKYIERRIGSISLDNRRTIQAAISTHGSVRVMAGAATVLSGFLELEEGIPVEKCAIETALIRKIVNKVEEIFGSPPEKRTK